jgi:ribosomal protein S18 acetylase RimI-like enzyme
MQDALSIEIRPYDESLAEDIARMWNSWDDLWPGTFTRGVPYTGERVKKQWEKISALALLIAIDTRTNKPVGSCTLHTNWRDKEAAYIGTLGVSPEALNKKVGKQLLLESIRICSTLGFTRVDLNTWPGNMRAVPLYKKVGMMWDPEGLGLTMYDYIPGILSHPFCVPFFNSLNDQHDWYDIQVRDLAQAPDDYSKDGMAFYPYEFRFGNSSLNVTVDRYARGITAIRRDLGGRIDSITATVDSHEAICGLPQRYCLEIENGAKDEIHATVLLTGFAGLEFNTNNAKTLDIGPGKKVVWEVPFRLSSSAPLFRDNIKTPFITAKVNIDGVESELLTGLKIRSPAEIRTRWGECLIRPMGKCRIPLTVLSNVAEASVTHINLNQLPSGINAKLAAEVINLDPLGQGGTMIEISASEALEDGVHYLSLNISLDINGTGMVKTRDFRIPLFCLAKHDIAVGEDDRTRESIIVSPYYTASFAHEGAILSVEDRYSQTSLDLTVSSEIGPPFGINPFRFAEREVRTSMSEQGIVVSMSASHPDRPLTVEDRVVFEYGSGVIKHEQWVKNTGQGSHSFQSRLVGRGGGIVIAPGSVYLPLSAGIFKEPLGNSFFEYPSIPSSPSEFSEGWIAVENAEYAIGQAWDLNEVEEIRIFAGSPQMLIYPEVTLESGEAQNTTNMWLFLSARNWKDIQRLWSARVNHRYDDRISMHSDEIPKPILFIQSEPLILPHVSEKQMAIQIINPLKIAHNGMLEIEAPRGWSVTLQGNSKPTQLIRKDIQFADDMSFNIALTRTPKVQDGFAVHRGRSNLKMEYDVEKPIQLVVLGSSGNEVKVSQGIEQDRKVFRVQNGFLDFAVSPDYGGCLFSLRNHKQVEFLTSSFPNAAPRPGAWFENYYGGVQPVIFDDDLGEPLTKARTNKEKMSAKPYHIGPWSGVEIKWIGKIQRTTRGVQSCLRYLTAPGCPLVLVQWIMTNNTSAPVRFYPTLSIDMKLDEELAGSQFKTIWSEQTLYIRNRESPMFVTPSTNLTWVMPEKANRKTKGISLLVAGNSANMLNGFFGDNLAMSAFDGLSAIMPHEERSILACLYIDPPDWETLLETKSILGSLIPKQKK